MKEDQGKLVIVTDHQNKPRIICLCGRESPHAQRPGCEHPSPGTPWWALDDAEPGEKVAIHLPTKTIYVTVDAVQELSAAA